MTQENLGLILDLYKEGKIERDAAISLVEDLAANRSNNWVWTTPSYPEIHTYYHKDSNPFEPPYTTFSTNKAELLKQYGDNQMPKMSM